GAPKLRRRLDDFTNRRLPQQDGAASFRRLLGCAPMIVARLPPRRRGSSARATVSLMITAGRMGWLERRSDLTARRPLPHETFIAGLLPDGTNSPDGCVWFLGAVGGVLLKEWSCSFLICAA